MKQTIDVLVIDDNPIVQRALQLLIDSYEDLNRVGTVDSAEAALEFIDEHEPPDLVLLDMVMPGMGGFAFIEQCHNKYPGTKIIVLTSYETNVSREEVMAAGVDAYVIKNTGMDAIADTIRKVYKKN